MMYTTSAARVIPESKGYSPFLAALNSARSLENDMDMHGLSYHPSYTAWTNMMTRCYNPKHNRSQYYKDKGIRVCERWHDARNFIEDMGDRPAGLTLERLDGNADYTPRNCIWADHTAQNRNKSNIVLTLEAAKRIRDAYASGVTQTAMAKEYGVRQTTISNICTGKTWL